MELLEIVTSENKDVDKYVFVVDGLIMEFSYINKNDGKDIICVPSETMCNLACKFCHTTEFIGKIPVRPLTFREYYKGVDAIIKDKGLKDNGRMLLISFMGCGEPMNNVTSITQFMAQMCNEYGDNNVRFAVATLIPYNRIKEFFEFIELVHRFALPVKLHLSLHYTDDEVRGEWMPAALGIRAGIAAVNYYHQRTGEKIEIHYTLIDGVNDSDEDAKKLAALLFKTAFNVKFLYYNERDEVYAKRSAESKVDVFKKYFDPMNIPHEYKIPDGIDIGSSCGQFLREVEYYIPPGLDIGASCGQFNFAKEEE